MLHARRTEYKHKYSIRVTKLQGVKQLGRCPVPAHSKSHTNNQNRCIELRTDTGKLHTKSNSLHDAQQNQQNLTRLCRLAYH